MKDPREIVERAIEIGSISMDEIEELAEDLGEEGYGGEAHDAIDELFEHTYERRDVKVNE